MFPYQMPFFDPFIQQQIPPQLMQHNTVRLTQKLGQKYQFSLQQKIGSGMTGDVYLGINKQTSEIVCIKVIDRLGFVSEKQKTMLEHQIKCQELVQSEYTVNILDVFDTSSFCFIVTELCEGGDLYKLIKMTHSGLNQNVAIKLGKQIALALKRLKQMQIIHRDIKSENILLRHGDAKLGDYGFAIEQKNLEKEEPFNLGSPIYMSLEALQQSKYSYASDIFAFGIVLYQMLHKLSPWECQSQQQLIQKIKTQTIRFKEGLNDQLKDLITKCLQRDVNKRITIEQALQYKVFKNFNQQKMKSEVEVEIEAQEKDLTTPERDHIQAGIQKSEKKISTSDTIQLKQAQKQNIQQPKKNAQINQKTLTGAKTQNCQKISIQ